MAVYRVTVPAKYSATLVVLRHRLGFSQQQLVAKVGAAATQTLDPQDMVWEQWPPDVTLLTLTRSETSRGAVRGSPGQS